MFIVLFVVFIHLYMIYFVNVFSNLITWSINIQYNTIVLQSQFSRTELDVKSIHGTAVIFLQNDAGFAKWGPTPDRVKKLLLSYKTKDTVA